MGTQLGRKTRVTTPHSSSASPAGVMFRETQTHLIFRGFKLAGASSEIHVPEADADARSREESRNKALRTSREVFLGSWGLLQPKPRMSHVLVSLSVMRSFVAVINAP